MVFFLEAPFPLSSSKQNDWKAKAFLFWVNIHLDTVFEVQLWDNGEDCATNGSLSHKQLCHESLSAKSEATLSSAVLRVCASPYVCVYPLSISLFLFSLLLKDNAELFAMMEKTRMYIFRNLDPEVFVKRNISLYLLL